MTTWSTHKSAIALRVCRWSCFALWAFTLASCPAFAQTNAINAKSPYSASTPQEATSKLVANADCDQGYWIISSRHALKEIESGQSFEYQVYRFDGSNPGYCSSMDAMLGSFQPTVPVCFMVHGSFLKWESVLNDSQRTNCWLRNAAPHRPIHLIFFSWPSNDGDFIPHLKVHELGHRSSLNGFYLADIVSKVDQNHPISLIGHSHGTRLVSASLHAMAGGVVDGRKLSNGPLPSRRIRVVLAAAAIDHNWLNPDERYGMALCPVEALLNLRNREDFPLLFYQLPLPVAQRAALAITGATRRDRSKMGEWSQKFVNYDVTNRVGYGHLWKHYYNDPTIAMAIRHYVFFDDE